MLIRLFYSGQPRQHQRALKERRKSAGNLTFSVSNRAGIVRLPKGARALGCCQSLWFYNARSDVWGGPACRYLNDRDRVVLYPSSVLIKRITCDG